MLQHCEWQPACKSSAKQVTYDQCKLHRTTSKSPRRKLQWNFTNTMKEAHPYITDVQYAVVVEGEKKKKPTFRWFSLLQLQKRPSLVQFCPKQRSVGWLNWLLSHAAYYSYGWTFFSRVALCGKILLEFQGEGRENILKMRSNLIPTTSLYLQSDSTIWNAFCFKQVRKQSAWQRKREHFTDKKINL